MRDIVVVGDRQNEFLIEITSESDPTKTQTQRFKLVDRGGSLTPHSIKEQLINLLSGKKDIEKPLPKRKDKFWRHYKQREDDLIVKIVSKKGKNKETYQLLSQKLGRPERTIKNRSNYLIKKAKLPLSKGGKHWTKEEWETLKEHQGKMSPNKIHQDFFPHKTRAAVYTKLSLLKTGKVDLVKMWHEEGRPNIKLSEVRNGD